MIERLAPHRLFRSGISPVTFVRDDEIKRMDRDIHLICILINRFIVGSKNRAAPEEVDRHPLDGADIDKRKTRFGFKKII